MSKRKSQTAVADYIAQGFTREALVNYFAFLGWSPGTEEDVLSRSTRSSTGSSSTRSRRAAPGSTASGSSGSTASGSGGSTTTTSSTGCCRSSRRRALAGELDRVPGDGRAALPAADHPRADPDPRLDRRHRRASCGATSSRSTRRRSCPKRWDAATTRDGLAAAREVLAAHDAVTWEADELEPPLRTLVEARGWKAGDLFMAIRVATTGQTATPPLFDTLVALGRERTLARLDAAIARLGAA